MSVPAGRLATCVLAPRSGVVLPSLAPECVCCGWDTCVSACGHLQRGELGEQPGVEDRHDGVRVLWGDRGEIREMWGDIPCLGVRDEDVERLRDMGRCGGYMGDVGRYSRLAAAGGRP